MDIHRIQTLFPYLMGNMIWINKNGASSGSGRLLAINDDHVVLETEEEVIYYKAEKMKNITFSSKEYFEYDFENRRLSHVNFPRFAELIRRFKYRKVQINCGEFGSTKGIISNSQDGEVFVVSGNDIIVLQEEDIYQISYVNSFSIQKNKGKNSCYEEKENASLSNKAIDVSEKSVEITFDKEQGAVLSSEGSSNVVEEVVEESSEKEQVVVLSSEEPDDVVEAIVETASEKEQVVVLSSEEPGDVVEAIVETASEKEQVVVLSSEEPDDVVEVIVETASEKEQVAALSSEKPGDVVEVIVETASEKEQVAALSSEEPGDVVEAIVEVLSEKGQVVVLSSEESGNVIEATVETTFEKKQADVPGEPVDLPKETVSMLYREKDIDVISNTKRKRAARKDENINKKYNQGNVRKAKQKRSNVSRVIWLSNEVRCRTSIL
jgi:putative heme iron utilization protein